MDRKPTTAADIRAAAAAWSPRPHGVAAGARASTSSGVRWAYLPGTRASAVRDRLVREGFAANRFVHYSENFEEVPRTVEFRWASDQPTIVVGSGRVSAIDGCDLQALDGERYRVQGGSTLAVRVEVGPGAVPALGFASSVPAVVARAAPDDEDVDAEVVEGGVRAPHLESEPVVHVEMGAVPGREGLWDAGATVLGRPVFSASGHPVVRSGESPDEALADSVHETRHDVVEIAPGRWTTRHRLGFRFLRVDGVTTTGVTVEANFRPPREDPGAFVCSDDGLNRIWAAASYTVHLCAQGLMLDGVKRDRMPWMGDQALNIVSNAYTLADGPLVVDGLVALGRVRDGYVNGLADYSLWWVIAQSVALRYIGTESHLTAEADRIDAFVRGLARQTTDSGVFRPVRDETAFAGLDTPVLIDWGVDIEPDRDLGALQVLWYWALRSADEVLTTVGHPGAARWAALADRVAEVLRSRCWDADRGVWRTYLDDDANDEDVPSPYPAFLAFLAGLTPPGEQPSELVDAPVGTPFMNGFALLARARSGDPAGAVDRLRALWSPMLDAGATTFWEEFTAPGHSDWEMYDRPFGKSLAHAWGAAPAAILPEAVLGVRPAAAGWDRFTVDPSLGGLEWASAVVPTRHGAVVVVADRSECVVEVPTGTTLETCDGVVPGPAVVTLACSGEWRGTEDRRGAVVAR
ncbi:MULTISPECIES: alpha-L-rhamnosidase-related protein [Curtobacterium]|uniref:alpha-L-rhamnosidase-related protein n=1 Tax=Curtobacterium flaccumfaciens TaxID=2035 RepID=UPI003EE6541E